MQSQIKKNITKHIDLKHSGLVLIAIGLSNDHTALASPFFMDLQEPTADIDIVYINHPQCGGPHSQDSQEHDDDKISQAPKTLCTGTEVFY